jgi:mRNA interferase MazF
MMFSRGDVVLVDYPFSDRTGSKVRPALIVQADLLNQRITDTILASISRSTHRASATQLFIDISARDGDQTGLRQNSMIQCENLLTCDQRLIIAKIGELPGALMHQVNACLMAALDLRPELARGES